MVGFIRVVEHRIGDDDVADVFVEDRRRRLVRVRSSVIDGLGVHEWGDAAETGDVPLGVIGEHDQPIGGGDERPVGLGLHEVGCPETGAFGDAVHAHEDHVEVERCAAS